MDVTGQEYRRMSKRAAPASPVLVNCLKAFVFGGGICALGQAIVMLGLQLGLPKKEAGILCSLSLIALSVLLTGCQVYDNIARHAGAGTLVPITGFANSIASTAIEFKSEGLILGLGAKMFTIAGPVLVYGITASVVYGIVLCILQLL